MLRDRRPARRRRHHGPGDQRRVGGAGRSGWSPRPSQAGARAVGPGRHRSPAPTWPAATSCARPCVLDVPDAGRAGGRGAVRPDGAAAALRPTSTRCWPAPTPASSAWAPRCGPPTRSAPSRSPGASRPASLRQHPQPHRACRCGRRSAASSAPAGAASTATRACGEYAQTCVIHAPAAFRPGGDRAGGERLPGLTAPPPPDRSPPPVHTAPPDRAPARSTPPPADRSPPPGPHRIGAPATAGAPIRVPGSVLAQQRTRAVDLVVDAVVAQRHPPGGGVDRDDRLAEPALGLVGQASPSTGSCRTARSRRRRGRRPRGSRRAARPAVTWAMETAVGHFRPLIAATSKPSSLKNLTTFSSPIGLVRRDDADPLGAVELQRPLARLGAGGDLQPGDVLDLLDELPVALDAVPEGLGGHAHHHVVGLGRSGPARRPSRSRRGSGSAGSRSCRRSTGPGCGCGCGRSARSPRAPSSGRSPARRWCWWRGR